MSRIFNPHLTATDGPLRGQTFALDEDEIGIGRESANLLAVEDASISRRHCVIRRLPAGGFEIRDLESRNGTFINGLPVTDKVLEDGDEIKVGKCVFTFHLTEEYSSSSEPAPSEEPVTKTEFRLQLRQEDPLYLTPQKLLEGPAVPGHLGRGLTTLLRISGGLQIARGTDELARHLLQLTLEAIPAQRGAILLLEARCEEPVWAYVWDRDRGPAGTFRVRLPVINEAWREGVAILSNISVDAFCDTEPSAESIPRKILVAPILSHDKALGVMCLDSADPRVNFDQEHLQLITAIGSIAGIAIENTRRLERLEAENSRLRQEIEIEHDMVGTSPRMREVYRFIGKVAPTEATVLLRGESGTGKELVARAIHRNSPRAAEPFVAINCATLTETLLESELFGHEKGAFTGAVALKKGKLEDAAGGTVFLDEVGELPLSLQAKLLRVLQERQFERVGGNRPLRADVRLIAATNRELERALATGAFRKDLYYRLNVVPLTLPPLRDRREDIPLLAAHFSAKHSRRSRRPSVPEISPAALDCLLGYDWPGNVRELENSIERAIVLGSSNVILPADLPEAVLETARAASAPIGTYQEAVCEEKKRVILNALEQAGGIFTEAARLLGVHPNYLHRLVRNLNLKSTVGKTGAGQPNG